MFVLGLLCFFLAVAVLCHDTPVGKYLRTTLIDTPADKLAKLVWAKVIVALFLTTLFFCALYVGFNVNDGIVVFYALPHAIGWMAAFDIATLMELTIALTFAAAYVRIGEALQFIRSRVAALFAPKALRAARAARARRVHPKRGVLSANDDDASGAGAYAFAA